ncbi:MAG TPA: ribonuclease J [Candidatus Caccovivens faecavium]|nr:ribonuclease J [Candidatus Caccovivens faecavium]
MNKLKITFLGGVGEIGKNMTAFEYGDDIIVVDAGLTFPGDDMPGIDVVVPDISYLLANKDKVRAIILTHGHEDHIGGLPFVLDQIKAPIYGSRLTLALVENKMKEYPKVQYKAISVKPKNVLKIGPFAIEFIKVSHSIAGSMALCISTPAGNVIHTGDFKIDFEPIDGVMTDLQRFGELGKKGVNLLLCESTNVCRKGYSMSEKSVGRALEEIFEKHPDNRLIVATFASNIHRLQQILNLAEKFGRKVAFTGRSMVNISEVGLKLGEITFDKKNLIDIDKIGKYADSELLIVTTGSQGEPMSALTRMAGDDFKGVKIGSNDLIVLSSSPIPGNEKGVYNVINALYQKGADVIYDELSDVHASGHACQEEIKIMHSLCKPKFFIPIHGEYRHLMMHKRLAMALGMEERNIILPTIGLQVELTPNSIKKSGLVTAGQRLIDGYGIGDMDSNVLRERKQLSEDGFCVVVVNINNVSGNVTGDPFIITRGVVYQDEAESFVQDAKNMIIASLKEQDLRGAEPSVIKNTIRRNVSNFIFKRTKRRPMVLAIVFLN